MDKLIEFDMSMAIANQMATSMNQSLNQMKVPGAGKAMPQKSEDIYLPLSMVSRRDHTL